MATRVSIEAYKRNTITGESSIVQIDQGSAPVEVSGRVISIADCNVMGVETQASRFELPNPAHFGSWTKRLYLGIGLADGTPTVHWRNIDTGFLYVAQLDANGYGGYDLTPLTPVLYPNNLGPVTDRRRQGVAQTYVVTGSSQSRFMDAAAAPFLNGAYMEMFNSGIGNGDYYLGANQTILNASAGSHHGGTAGRHLTAHDRKPVGVTALAGQNGGHILLSAEHALASGAAFTAYTAPAGDVFIIEPYTNNIDDPSRMSNWLALLYQLAKRGIPTIVCTGYSAYSGTGLLPAGKNAWGGAAATDTMLRLARSWGFAVSDWMSLQFAKIILDNSTTPTLADTIHPKCDPALNAGKLAPYAGCGSECAAKSLRNHLQPSVDVPQCQLKAPVTLTESTRAGGEWLTITPRALPAMTGSPEIATAPDEYTNYGIKAFGDHYAARSEERVVCKLENGESVHFSATCPLAIGIEYYITNVASAALFRNGVQISTMNIASTAGQLNSSFCWNPQEAELGNSAVDWATAGEQSFEIRCTSGGPVTLGHVWIRTRPMTEVLPWSLKAVAGTWALATVNNVACLTTTGTGATVLASGKCKQMAFRVAQSSNAAGVVTPYWDGVAGTPVTLTNTDKFILISKNFTSYGEHTGALKFTTPGGETLAVARAELVAM